MAACRSTCTIGWREWWLKCNPAPQTRGVRRKRRSYADDTRARTLGPRTHYRRTTCILCGSANLALALPLSPRLSATTTSPPTGSIRTRNASAWT